MSTAVDLGAIRTARRRTVLLRWTIAVASVLVLAGIAAVAWFSPLLAIESVTAEGGGIVDAEAVRADVQESTVGTPLPQVRTGGLAEQLEAEHTAAADIEVSYAGPRSLHIVVTDRVPVVAVADGAQAVRYDADGAAIDTVPADAADVPTLTVASQADAAAAARDGARLLTDIGGRLPGEAKTLAVGATGTFTLRLAMEDGDAEVVFGTAEDAERKARVASVLLDEGHDTIDVSVPDVPKVG